MPKLANRELKKKVAVSSKKTKKTATPARRKKVSAIPKGFPSLTPYLIMSESAAEAIKFYKKVFRAKEAHKMKLQGGKIAHAELIIDNARFMLADEFPEMDAHGPSNYGGTPINLHLYVEAVDQVFKKAIQNGAKELMPIEDRFYGDRSGTIEDPYGYKWTLSTHIEDLTPAQIKKRATQFFRNKKAK
jgi:PhnB protein